MSDFIDLHCHVLPGLDDGATSLDDAVFLVRELRRLGFGELHPTPHQMAGRWQPSPARRTTAAAALRTALSEAEIDVIVAPPAGENMWDELFLTRRDDRSFPTYDGHKAFLIEFPATGLPPNLPERLFELRVLGLLPVIAHIERWPELASDPALLDSLRGKAALLVNLSSVGGQAGWRARRLARSLVLENRVHALTTDTHGAPDLVASGAGLAWLEGQLGRGGLERFLLTGPQAILAGEIPEGA